MKTVILALMTAIAALTISFPQAYKGKSTLLGVKEIEAGERPGRLIRQTDAKGYRLSYYLLDRAENAEMEKAMAHHSVVGMHKGHGATNHLMVYIETADARILPGDVAFVITGSDGKGITTMTMGMYGGYGADINLGGKGQYKIRTKINLDRGIRLDDEFPYQVE